MGTNLLVTFSMANCNTLSNWTLGTKANFYCSHNFKQPGKMFPILLLLEISVCHVQQSAMSLLWLTLNKTFAWTFIGQMCKTRSLQIVHMSIGSGVTEILNCISVNIFCCEEASKHLCVFSFFFDERTLSICISLGGGGGGGGWQKLGLRDLREWTHTASSIDWRQPCMADEPKRKSSFSPSSDTLSVFGVLRYVPIWYSQRKCQKKRSCYKAVQQNSTNRPCTPNQHRCSTNWAGDLTKWQGYMSQRSLKITEEQRKKLQNEEEEEEEIREWGQMTNKSHGPQVITKQQQLHKYQVKFFFQQHSDSLFHCSKREPKDSQAALLSFFW